MSEKKLKQLLFAGLVSASTLLPNLSAMSKPIESSTNAIEQQESTPKQDLDRYGRKIKRGFQRFKNNIGERIKDRNSWEAKKCELTKSTTQRCRDLRNKSKN